MLGGDEFVDDACVKFGRRTRQQAANIFRRRIKQSLARDCLAVMEESATERVARLLGELPASHRDVLTCRFLLNLKIRETALRLGLSEANVKVTQLRALKRAAELASIVFDD